MTENGGHSHPNRKDLKGRIEDQAMSVAVTTGMTVNGSAPTGTGHTGVLNPELSLWLLGYPEQWLSLAP